MEALLAELAKIFRDFIYRDAVYIGGGFTILLSGLYTINQLEISSWSTIHVVYFIFLSYVLGYTTLEVFSILGIVTTDYQKPKRLICWLLRKWAGGDWTNMPTRDELPYERLSLILAKAHIDMRNIIYRIINLKQLGSTTGACFLLSSAILCLKIIHQGKSYFQQDVYIMTGLFIVGGVLAIMGKMQASYQVRFMMEIDKKPEKRTTQKLRLPQKVKKGK